MLRDYGGTLLAFHITISLISLGACYVVIIRSVVIVCFPWDLFKNRSLSLLAEISNIEDLIYVYIAEIFIRIHFNIHTIEDFKLNRKFNIRK